MAKQQKPPIRKAAPQPAVRSARKADATTGIPDTLEAHFGANSRAYLWTILGLSVLFSLFCFDTKISTANDDALYIEAGANYAKNFFGYFYTGNAPLYPMLLGLIIKIAGMKLLLLKSFSILFFTLGLFIVYRGFEKHIPYSVLVPSMLITAISFPFLMYASLTYSETFSFLVFGLGFWAVNKLSDEASDLQQWKLWTGLALIFFVQMLTRNVALVAIGVLLLYLIYRKHYIGTAITGGLYGVLFIVYKLSLTYIWKLDSSQFSYQSARMYQKDAYNPQLGNEDAWGFVVRFWENCRIYMSSRLYYVLGFREEMSPVNTVLTILTIGILLWAFILMFRRKQHALLFATFYFAALLGITFVSLQTSWGQTRLIMIYLPFILFAFFFLLYHYGKQIAPLQYLLPVVFFILLTAGLAATFRNIKLRLPVFIENVTGDPTYGFTTDWQNYIRMSIWCKNNLPDTTVVAVRKPPMSYIFSGGKEFYGIYNTPAYDADSLLTPLRNNRVEYVVISELRIDPSRYLQGQFINTVHRYAYFIMQKYPNAFQFVHREGEIETADLYKINYAYIDSMKNAINTGPAAIIKQ